MKAWKKILTLALLFMTSVFTCVACGKSGKYDNMSIGITAEGLLENNTINLSSDTTKNVFTLIVKVDGVGNDVSKAVNFTIDNQSVVVFNGGTYINGVTTAKFTAKSDGDTIIHVNTEEGNKTASFPIKVAVPINMLTVKNNLIPLVRGTEARLDVGDDYLIYTPSNTTQREVKYFAEPINEVDTSDVSKINEYINSNSGKIKVPSDTNIYSFYLTIISLYDESINQRAIVNVFDAPNIQDVLITEATKTEDSYPLLTYDDLTGEYALTLGLNNGEFFNYHHTNLQLTYNSNLFSENTTLYQRYDNSMNVIEVDIPRYSVSIKNLGIDNRFSDTGIITASKIGDGLFDIIRTSTEGEYTLKFVIDYYGYAGRFTPLEIPVKVKTIMFPSEIKLFATRDEMEMATKETLGLQNGDIVLYSNGENTAVYIDIWSDTDSLSRQPIAISINNENVDILDQDGMIIDSCIGGDLIYLRKADVQLAGDVILTLTSTIFETVSRDVVLTYINENTEISIDKTDVALDPAYFTQNPAEINNPNTPINLIAMGYVTFRGIPKLENGSYDYSTISVTVEDESFVVIYYNAESNSLLMNVKNKIGSTKVTFKTENGLSSTCELIVHYPIDDASFFKLQLENFENFETDPQLAEDEYVYQFAGQFFDSPEKYTYKTQLLVGETYNFYYLLGSQIYNDLTGIMVINNPTSSNNSCIELSGKLIKVKKYSAEPIKLSFTYITAVTNQIIIVEIDVHLVRRITSVSSEQYNFTIYDLSTLNSYAVDQTTRQSYVDLYGTKEISLKLNPINANTDYVISWGAGSVEGGKFANTGTNKAYLFNPQGKTSIKLTPSEDNLNAVVTVSDIPSSDKLYTFKVYAFVYQTYISASGQETTDELNVEVVVTVKKASRVSDINTKIFDNRVYFDIRNMQYDSGTGIFSSNNIFDFEYELMIDDDILLTADEERENLLNRDVTIYTPNSDINVTKLDSGNMRLTFHKMSDSYLDYPVYSIYIVANDSQYREITDDIEITANNVRSYFSSISIITVRVANGKTVPFEIDTAQELIQIGDTSRYSDALNANYVITKNIYLDEYNWQPIGDADNKFNGTLSGRYYLTDDTYRDYGIYNLKINVNNSLAQIIKDEYSYGLFAYIGANAVIKNVGVYNYSINIVGFSETYNRSSLVENIGVIAGVNEGTIIDCEVDDGIFGDNFNGTLINSNKSTTRGINYNSNTSNLKTEINIGGVVGYNKNKIETTTIKGFISVNDNANLTKFIRTGGIAGINAGIIKSNNNDFVVTNGLEGFDVVVAINAHQDISKTTSNGYYGGVAGVNIGLLDEGRINGLSVRSFVFAKSNAGGLVGYNNSYVEENVVIPILIGENNIGGLIGVSNNGSEATMDAFKSGYNIVKSNKVQFIDFSDVVSYFNTSIYGSSNIGGLIGEYSTSPVISNTQITFNSVLAYNSVSTYYNRNIATNNYSLTNSSGFYYGDIVVKSDENQYVSGFIGNANNVLISSGYANVNIRFEANNSTYIGGAIGKASGIVSIFNTSVLGTVYNTSDSYSANEYVGSFIGEASEINTYISFSGDTAITRYLIDIPSTTYKDASNKYYILETGVNTSLSYSQLSSYKNYAELLPINEINLSFIYEKDIIDNICGLQFKFGNIVSSYSLLNINEVDFNDIDTDTDINERIQVYIDNFVANGYTRKIVSNENVFGSQGNVPSLMAIKVDNGDGTNTAYLTSEIYVTNIVTYNSFYVGYNAEFKLDISVKDQSGTSFQEIVLPSHVVVVEDINKAYIENNTFNLAGTISGLSSFDYYLSLYNLENEYIIDGKTVTTRAFYHNNIIVNFQGNTTEGGAKNSFTYNQSATYTTADSRVVSIGGEAISTQSGVALKDLYVCANTNDTGLNDNIDEIDNYYRYYNSQVHSRLPLSFAEKKYFTQDNKDYVNLIINLPPTIIIIGEDNKINSKVDYKNIWLGSSETNGKLKAENTTIYYYALDYNKVKNNIQTVNGEQLRVIDFNNDGKYTQLDISYTNYINSIIDNNNLYRVADIVGISILPPFLQNGMISFSSSDKNIAEIQVIGYEPYIKVNGIGTVTFDVYSPYNPNVKTEFTINIINAINTFGLFEDLTYTNEISVDNIQVIKNEELSTPLYANLFGNLSYNNAQLEKYSKIPLTLASNSTYGVRYFLMNGDTIYFDNGVETECTALKLSGKSFTKLAFDSIYGANVDGKYALYVDCGLETSLVGLEKAQNIRILAVPYVVNNGERTYLYDFTQANATSYLQNNGVAKILNIDVIEGTYAISTPEQATFKPINAQDISVEVQTDNEYNQLFFNITKDGLRVDVYSDLEKTTKLSTSNTIKLYNQAINGIVVNEADNILVTPYLNQTFYFDKMYLKLISVEYNRDVDGNLTSKIYNFRIGVHSNYLFDTNLINTYNIDFLVASYKGSGTNHEILSSDIDVIVERQNISDTIIKHYSAVDQYIYNTSGETYERNDYYESNTLISGYPGMLQLDLFPKYANVDYVEFVSSDINGYFVSLEQLVAVYDNTNSYFDGYYKTYTDTREIIEDGRGIRVRNHSITYKQGDTQNYLFDGTYYIRTLVPTVPFGMNDFVITYKCYFEGQVVFEDSITISVTRCPSVDLSINGEDTGVVAFGNSININTISDAEITWSVSDGFNTVATSELPIQIDSNSYSITIKPISEISNQLNGYRDYIGKEYEIKATVSIDVKGRIYSSSDTVKIKLALFTIDQVTVENVTDNVFYGTYNQPYELKVGLKATYDQEYDRNNGYFISNQISYYADLLSNKASKTFFVMNGNQEMNIIEGQYDDFLISSNEKYYILKNNMKYPTSILKAKTIIEYTTYSQDNPYGVIFNPRTYVSKFVYQKDCSFELEFVRLSNEEYPEPIYTALEFKNMVEGGYYILLADITLKDWQPLDTKIASLDGNGYVITIDSFYDTHLEIVKNDNEDTEREEHELKLGIFSTISSNTTIKNLTIEVKNNELLTSDVITGNYGDLVIDVANYTKVEFGLLAGVNEGIVTNTTITNNANKLRNERNKLLFNNGLAQSFTELSEINYSADINKTKRNVSIINLNYGDLTSVATENRIGGLFGVNKGYITNSNVNNISIKGLDCVAGLVAENLNTISSSYYAGGTINAQVSAENTETLGASAFVFYNSGKIAYSYSAGANYTGSKGNITGINDLTVFTGNTYQSIIQLRMRNTAVISESGNTSGFVYNNSGTITDCYSNILVYGNKSVGFVYLNSGTINNVYTLSSILESDTNNNAFISLTNNNTQSNNTGTITNAYYLKVIQSDKNDKITSSDPLDKYLNESLQIASPLSANKLANYNTFESFAFNSNYDSALSINYDDVTISSVEEITRSVWFYPNAETGKSSYFRRSDYVQGAPQLVSANLNTLSLKYYVDDNNSKIVEAIYSNMLNEHSDIMMEITRNKIVPSMITVSASSLSSRLSMSEENIVSNMKAYANLYSVDEITDIKAKYSSLNTTLLNSSVIQYIVIDLYLSEELYDKVNTTKSIAITNTITKAILDSQVFSSYCYIVVNIQEETEDNAVPEVVSNYEYYSILKNTEGLNIEYGQGVLNPYLIKSATDYNVFIKQLDDNNRSAVEKNYKSDNYLRFISDIAFNGNTLTAETFNVIFLGVLDGNGMSISDLRINADTTKSSNAINKQQSGNYEEIETYEVNGETRKATSVGMFAKLTNGAVVKNLTVNIAEIYGTGVNFVGVIAGQVIDSKVYNITVNGEGVEVLGYNAVGGIAGRVTGNSTLVNLTSNVSITSNYYNNYNTFDKDNISADSQFNVYIPSKTVSGVYTPSNFSQVSLAGGIAGIIDLSEESLTSDTSLSIDTSVMGKIRQNKMFGEVTIIGEVVGGLYGYIGNNSVITTNSVEVGEKTILDASRVAGGLVGINLGQITRSYVSNRQDTQDSIDTTLSTLATTTTQLYGDNINTGSETFFGGNPHFMGGLIGINLDGQVTNSYNRVNVNNINAMYAGGIIGVSVGGGINAVYTTADVYAFKTIGGIIGINIDATTLQDNNGVGNDLQKYTNNYEAFKPSNSSSVNLEGVVAINLWKLQHLNTRRYHINENAGNQAYIGSIVGYNSNGATIAVDEKLTRQLKENIYTIATYTYDSIVEYNNSTARDSFISFKLIDEIGNRSSSENVLVEHLDQDATTTEIDYYQNNTQFMYCQKFGDWELYSGNVIYTNYDATENKYSYSESGHFSRFREFSSIRTLKEIISRVYIKDEAVNMLKRMSDTAVDDNNNKDVEDSVINNMESTTFRVHPATTIYEINGNTTRQSIYPSPIWNSTIWSGIGINSASYEKVDNYILPVHEAKVNDPVIYVYSYSDLLKVDEYLNGTFILMNDISVTASEYKPLATIGAPFTGTLISNPLEFTEVNGEPIVNRKTITIESGLTNFTGLFAAVKGAYFGDFNIVVKSNITIEDGTTAVGALFGYGYAKGYTPNTLDNMNITFDGTSINATSDFSVSYIGGVAGIANALDINNVVVNNPSIIIDGTTDSLKNSNMYIGTFAGSGSISSLTGSNNLTINNANIMLDIGFKEGYYNTLAIGGIMGKVENTSANGDGNFTFNGIELNNPSININIFAIENKFVSFETAGIGGAFGLAEGLPLSDTFVIKDLTIKKGASTTLNINNTGVYASSIYSGKGNFSIGGLVGQIGGNNNSFITIIDFTNSLEEITYVHSNTSTHLNSINRNSEINISSLIGSVLSSQGELNNLTSSTLLKWSLIENDKVNVNIGSLLGKMSGGRASNILNSANVQSDSNVEIGENTILNVGGIIGKMTGGSITKSGYNANIILTLKDNSYSHINIGGLVGYASVDSNEYVINECFASGKINLTTNNITQNQANIGGLVGFVYNALKISDSYSSNDIVTYKYGENNSYYNSVGGIVGLLEVSNYDAINFDLNRVFTISNIILNKSTDEKSSVAGIVGNAISSTGYDIQSSLKLDSAYYLAEFMIDTNAIGIGLSVEEMLYNNYAEGAIFQGNGVDGIWTFAENSYPTLNWLNTHASVATYLDTRLIPLVISNLTSIDSSYNAYIFTGTDNSYSNFSIVDTDIYLKNNLTLVSTDTIFTSIDNYSRIYGLHLDNCSSVIITDNYGKVAGTIINNLTSDNGYITNNYGMDINPVINNLTGHLYTTNQGLVIYPKITINNTSKNLFKDMLTSTGQVKLGVFTTSLTPTDVGICDNVIDSYITDGTNYVYYSHSGVSLELNGTESKDMLNFASDYDFYNDWIILPINSTILNNLSAEEKTTYLNNRRNGRVFLRWELKETIGENWYFEDIDMYSTTQTAYKDYVWNNYINDLLQANGIISSNDLELNSTNIVIKSAVGLAYYSRLINTANYTNYSVVLSSDIDLLDKLFTPISSGLILEYAGDNVFAGTFNGNNKTISNMYIISNNNAGLFSDSYGKGYKNVTITQAIILNTSGDVGIITSKLVENADISNIEVSNTTVLNTFNSENTIVGGLVGIVSTCNVNINNCSLGENVNILNGGYVGGLVGIVRNGNISIEQSSNSSIVTGKTNVGGMLGYLLEGEAIIIQSYNIGDVQSENYAGGLIGYSIGNTYIEQCYNSSSVIGDIVAGLVGYSQNKIAFKDCYVSRGDVGAYISGVQNYRNEDYTNTNMNDNSIIGLSQQSAFVNTTTFVDVEFDQCYSSLSGIDLTNGSASYNNTFIFGDSTSEFNKNVLNTITHSDLSQPNNDIFEKWSYVWSRVSQKNNNYPVLLFINGSWEGKAEFEPNQTTYEIRTAEELAWVADQVNSGNTFAGSTIILMEDIDLQKKLWNPIGHSETYSFQGTFNFNGKSIINLTTNGYYKNNIYTEENLVKDYVGLFGYTKNATLLGDLTLKRDQSTPNEGAHIQGLGNYVGALIGYAKDTSIDTNAQIVSELNIQGTGNYIGGLIGALEINGTINNYVAIKGATNTSITLGGLTNYGYTSGKPGATSQYVAGIIGGILTTNRDILSGNKSFTIEVNNLRNYGEVSNAAGNSGGVIAEVLGKGFVLNINDAYNASDIINASSNMGGILGYSNGTVNIKNVTISNDYVEDETLRNSQILMQNRNYKANIGAIIGSANIVTISNYTSDSNGIQISSENIINFAQAENVSGSVGGLFGEVNRLTLDVNDINVSNIEFVFANDVNYVGGVVGKVNELLTIKSSGNEPKTLNISNIKNISGVGYLGGIAGYVNAYTMDESQIILDNVSVTETTDINDENYLDLKNKNMSVFLNTYGNIGGAFGYIKQGVSSASVDLRNISVIDSDITKDTQIIGKTLYIGGLVGKIDAYASFTNITNEINIIGDISTKTQYVGGIAGYAGINIHSKVTSATHLSNTSTVVGYDFVGGLFGYITNATITSSNVNDSIIGYNENADNDANKYADTRIGGIVGESNNSSLDGLSVENSSIYGRNLVGGIVGTAINSTIGGSVVVLSKFGAISGQTNSLDNYKDVDDNKVTTAGGIVGYANNSGEITNVDVVINDVSDIKITFGGVAGYLNGINIYEASSDIALQEGNPNNNVRGIVYSTNNSSENVNLHSKNYWLLNDGSSSFNDLYSGIRMAYAEGVKSAPSSQDYNETVIYSTIAAINTIKLANGDKAVGWNIKCALSNTDNTVTVLDIVKQIYSEAGLWNYSFDGVKTTIALTNDMMQRAQSLEYNSSLKAYVVTLDEESENVSQYKYMYSAITKRFDNNASPKNLIINIYGDITNIVTTDNGNINAIGSKFFPINNLTIKGVSSNADKENAELKLSGTNFAISSSEINKFNLYGLIGYVDGSLDISNLTVSSENNVTAYDNTHYDPSNYISRNLSYNEYFGILVALASPTSYTSTIPTSNITHKFNNIELNVNTDYSTANIMGGLLGAVNADAKNREYVDNEGTINCTTKDIAIDYVLELSNIFNNGNFFNAAVASGENMPSIVGGIIGYSDARSLSTSNKYYDLRVLGVAKNIFDESLNRGEIYYLGLQNNGNIYAKHLAGGVVGYLGENVQLSASENIQEGLISNTGNIIAEPDSNIYSVAGGVIGAVKLGTSVSDENIISDASGSPVYSHILSNLYSGTFNWKENLSKNYKYYNKVGSSNSIYATYAGGIIGKVEGIATEHTGLKIINSQNYSDISTDIASGIMGIYSNVYSLEFNNNINQGSIICLSDTSVGGMLSSNTLSFKQTHYQLIDNIRNENLVYYNSNTLSTETLKILKFISCINSSENIKNSVNDSASYAGGLMGSAYLGNSEMTELIIQDCQSEGSVYAKDIAGGFVGYLLVQNTAIFTLTTTEDYKYKTEYIKYSSDDTYMIYALEDYAGGVIGSLVRNDNAVLQGNILNSTSGPTSEYILYTPNVNVVAGNSSGGFIGRYTSNGGTNDETLVIHNVTNNSDIVNKHSTIQYNGGILGTCTGNCTNLYFNNCTNQGKINIDNDTFDTQDIYVGGIIGEIGAGDYVEFNNCEVKYSNSFKYRIIQINTSMTDDQAAGGLVGYVPGGSSEIIINNCIVSGNIVGYYAGGFIGRTYTTAGVGSSMGDLLIKVEGSNYSELSNARVESYKSAGGVIGIADKTYFDISNVYVYNSSIQAVAETGNEDYAGGLIGRVNTTTGSRVYNINIMGGTISASGTNTSGGGLFGYIYESGISVSYYSFNNSSVNGVYTGGVIGYDKNAYSGDWLYLTNVIIGDDYGNSTLYGSHVAGFVGYYNNSECSSVSFEEKTSFTNCTFNRLLFDSYVNGTNVNVWSRTLLGDLKVKKSITTTNVYVDGSIYTSCITSASLSPQVSNIKIYEISNYGIPCSNNPTMLSGITVKLRSELSDGLEDIKICSIEELPASPSYIYDELTYTNRTDFNGIEEADSWIDDNKVSTNLTLDYNSYKNYYKSVKIYYKLMIEYNEYVYNTSYYKYY